MDFKSEDRERPAEFTNLPGPWEALSAAIVRTACEDYKEYKGKGRQDIEMFIQSEYFQRISNIDPDWLVRNLREMYRPETGLVKG